MLVIMDAATLALLPGLLPRKFFRSGPYPRVRSMPWSNAPRKWSTTPHYISDVRHVTRFLIPLLLVMIAPAVHAQNVHINTRGESDRIDLRTLREDLAAVPGQGLHVPGMELDEIASPRVLFGDGPDAMDRGLVDILWTGLSHTRDSVVPGVGVHWIR